MSDDGLVSGDGVGGDDYGVTGLNAYLLVGASRHAHEGGCGLALRAGGHDDGFFRDAGFELVGGDDQAVRHAEVAEFRGESDIVHHAAADDSESTSVYCRSIRHLLDSRDKRGKAGDDDSALRLTDETGQRLADDGLGGCVAGHVRVGGIG